MADPAIGPSKGGMSRRDLIKVERARCGAAAWTAPVIIDSLASPAAAEYAVVQDQRVLGAVARGSI